MEIRKLTTVFLLAMALVLSSCGKEEPRKWGKGEPPAEYQDLFGNSNNARLDFVQTDRINQHQNIIYGFNQQTPDGNVQRKRGLIERITALEDEIANLKKPKKKRW